MGKNNLIFGMHPLIEALEAGREIDKILLKRGLRSGEVSRIMALAEERMIPIQFVPEERLMRLTRKQHQGVIAFISEIEYTSLEQLIPLLYEQGRSPFFVLLDGLTDVRNFGAIARTAECAGVDALIIPALAVDRGGRRLGQGGGWYDRMLPLRRDGVGVFAMVYDDELVSGPLPTEEHDELVDAVITPSAWFLLEGSAFAAGS